MNTAPIAVLITTSMIIAISTEDPCNTDIVIGSGAVVVVVLVVVVLVDVVVVVVLVDVVVLEQGRNWQLLLGFLETYDPSGHIKTSAAHTIG